MENELKTELVTALKEAVSRLKEWGPSPSDHFWIAEVANPLIAKCSEQAYEQNTSNDGIPLLKTLPEGFVEENAWGYKVGRKPIEVLFQDKDNGVPIDSRIFYHCQYCEGWIEGSPSQHNEDTIGPLCGRRGTVTVCCRCTHEIGFCGMVS